MSRLSKCFLESYLVHRQLIEETVRDFELTYFADSCMFVRIVNLTGRSTVQTM